MNAEDRYVAVGTLPTDAIDVGTFVEVFSFVHYEKVILAQGSSSFGTCHQEQQQDPKTIEPKVKGPENIYWSLERKTYT